MALETPNHLFAAVCWDLLLDNGGPDYTVEVKRAINVSNFGLLDSGDFTAYRGTLIDRASQLELCCNALNSEPNTSFFVAPLLAPVVPPVVNTIPDGDFVLFTFPINVPVAPGERVLGYLQMHRLPLLAEAVA